MAKKKINTQDLVHKIEKLAKSRMLKQDVVSLDQFREMKNRPDPKTVVVVEDDAPMRTSIQRILESMGILVRTAADGTELSAVLDSQPPDLLILDIGLPWIDGLELGQMLKEHPDLKKIPLIYVSGTTSKEEMQKAFAIGADDFIQKPFDLDVLKNTVSVLLKLQSGES